MVNVTWEPTMIGNMKKKIVKPWKIEWARIIIDKAHKETTLLTKGSKIAGLYEAAAKWFVTGIPFERGPGQMQCWLSRINASSWFANKVRDRDY